MKPITTFPKSVDVLVVGAGPAGSLCSRDLAKKGYTVLLCEKRPKIGIPVRCGEATTGRKKLSRYTRIDESYIETDIHGLIFHGPHKSYLRWDKTGIGLMLDRERFDPHLAQEAVEAGAQLFLKARVFEIGPYSPQGRLCKIEQEGEIYTVQSKMVVGADGAEALSGRWVGLKSRQLPPYSCSAIELRIRGQDQNPNHLTFWQGHGTINEGYIWVFPKVKSGVLNVGAGIITPKMGAPNMHDVILEFKKKYFPQAEIEAIHGGCVPVSGALNEYTSDGFLLCGDAAHHTNPLTGGGIAAALCAGETAAAHIHLAFSKSDLSNGFLKEYERAVWIAFEKSHFKQKQLRDFLLKLTAIEQAQFYNAIHKLIGVHCNFFTKTWAFFSLASLCLRERSLLKQILQSPKPFV